MIPPVMKNVSNANSSKPPVSTESKVVSTPSPEKDLPAFPSTASVPLPPRPGAVIKVFGPEVLSLDNLLLGVNLVGTFGPLKVSHSSEFMLRSLLICILLQSCLVILSLSDFKTF